MREGIIHDGTWFLVRLCYVLLTYKSNILNKSALTVTSCVTAIYEFIIHSKRKHWIVKKLTCKTTINLC